MKFSYGMFMCTLTCLLALFVIDAQAQFGRNSQQIQQTQTVARPTRNAVPELDERAGPWLIMCASFVGEDAEAQSQNLIRELAQNGLNAYQYRHRFDYSQSIRGLGFDSNNGQQLADGRVVAKPKRCGPTMIPCSTKLQSWLVTFLHLRTRGLNRPWKASST